MKKCNNSNCKAREYIIPGAILLAGVFIAYAILNSNKYNNIKVSADNTQEVKEVKEIKQKDKEDKTQKVAKVTDKDHYRGSKDANIVIVEYTDLECPFCKRFHNTMERVLANQKDVKLVFRHFPLDSLHPKNARKAAEASECVDKLGGNDAFWKFVDEYFNTTKTNDRWNIDDELSRLIKVSGVDETEFDKCYSEHEFKEKVQKNVDNAIETGARGTPWSILITKKGKTVPINGAFSKERVEQLIEYARNN